MDVTETRPITVVELADMFAQAGNASEELLEQIMWATIENHGDHYTGWRIWKAIHMDPPSNIGLDARRKFAASLLKRMPPNGWPINEANRLFLPYTKPKVLWSQLQYVYAATHGGWADDLHLYVSDKNKVVGDGVLRACRGVPGWERLLEDAEQRIGGTER